jgi:DHA1 family tetracycline resistance protein-like MFS transporter
MKHPLIPIFLIVLVDILGMTLIMPLLPFYAERYGATPVVVGLLVSSYAACQLISGPVIGRMSDRIGRKPLLIVSQIGTFIGFLILAFSGSLWMIFVSRIIDGCTAGNISLAQAYIADVTKPEDRARSFGVLGIAFGLGFLVGPGVSGYLSQFGIHVPILAAAGLSATSILATTFLLPGGAPPQAPEAEGDALPVPRRQGVFDWQQYSVYFRRPVLAKYLWEFFLYAATFATFMSGFALFAERQYTYQGHPFGPKEIGYILTYVGFLGVIMQGGLIGRLVRAFGEKKLVTMGLATLVIAYGLLGFTHTILELLVVSTISSFGNGVLRPALTSLITQAAGRHEQGVVLGITQSLMSIAQIVSPGLAGLLIQRHYLVGWSMMAATAALLGLILNVQRRTSAIDRQLASTEPQSHLK